MLRASGEDYLVSRARSGDRDALARLVEANYAMMYRVALRWTKDPDTASDVVQDSCIKVINTISFFRGEARPAQTTVHAPGSNQLT